LDFFENTCQAFEINLPKNYEFIKGTTKKLPTHFEIIREKSGGANQIFKMWNGDKKSFWYYFFSLPYRTKNTFLNNSQIIENVCQKTFFASGYLLRGVYLYLFLEIFWNNSNLKSSILDIIIGFRYKHRQGKKNLHRLILNYIINKSEQLGKVNTINELGEKGVGLYDLLVKIEGFTKKVNEIAGQEIYSFEKETKSFFDKLSGIKIDFFANFFTIYKSQIDSDPDGKDVYSNYYNLQKEIEDYINNKNKKLNKIRIFNNDIAVYISLYMLTHFEMSSFFRAHGEEENELAIGKPLLFTCNRKENVVSVSRIQEFEFYDVIEAVYKQAKESVTAMVSFYIKYLINDFPPDKFIEDQLFSVRTNQIGNFQFRLLISRHITYLESFRQGLINGILMELDENENKVVNNYLIHKLQEYFRLYKTSFNKIRKALPPKSINSHHKLRTTLNTYNMFNKIANDILNQEIDIKTVIETDTIFKGKKGSGK
jgi:predicted Zn-dependent protease with MMP-like domain